MAHQASQWAMGWLENLETAGEFSLLPKCNLAQAA